MVTQLTCVGIRFRIRLSSVGPRTLPRAVHGRVVDPLEAEADGCGFGKSHL